MGRHPPPDARTGCAAPGIYRAGRALGPFRGGIPPPGDPGSRHRQNAPCSAGPLVASGSP